MTLVFFQPYNTISAAFCDSTCLYALDRKRRACRKYPNNRTDWPCTVHMCVSKCVDSLVRCRNIHLLIDGQGRPSCLYEISLVTWYVSACNYAQYRYIARSRFVSVTGVREITRYLCYIMIHFLKIVSTKNVPIIFTLVQVRFELKIHSANCISK